CTKMDDNEAQENELSLLKAMYQSNELIFGNPSTKLESDDEDNSGTIINQINNGLTKDREIAFCLKVKCSDLITMNLDVQFPTNYPSQAYPFVNARNGKINEVNLNKDLKEFIQSGLELGMPMALEIVNWIQENYAQYVVNGNARVATPTQHTYALLWIYSHHLYSHTKRKDLKMQAKRLELHGFSMPGKPSVIVVEGILEDCDEFWVLIRGWSWQDITLKRKEIFKGANLLKFQKFFELAAKSTVCDCKHSDRSLLKSTLKEYGLEENFDYLIEI
uniref:RWD domain-containing protein n=1 Tax=Acrobeloides nanus TaxID=290746 RepID=A0A914E907_9BILA